MHHDISVLTELAQSLQSCCHLSCCYYCRQRHRGPVVIVTQAAGGAQRLHHDLPGLADFPCCDIPARAADSKYPPLQWQQRAAKVAVHRVAAHGSWLQVGFVQEPGTMPIMGGCVAGLVRPETRGYVLVKHGQLATLYTFPHNIVIHLYEYRSGSASLYAMIWLHWPCLAWADALCRQLS